jgi:hypothetical protein
MGTVRSQHDTTVKDEKSHIHEVYADRLMLMHEMFFHDSGSQQHSEQEILTVTCFPTLIEIIVQEETISLARSIVEERCQPFLAKLAEQHSIECCSPSQHKYC